MAKIKNPHPGEILKKEFLAEINLSQNALAYAIDVPPNRIHAIINGQRSITADTDLRLCKFFGLSEGYFLRLQNAYDLMEAKRLVSKKIDTIKPYFPEIIIKRKNHNGKTERKLISQTIPKHA